MKKASGGNAMGVRKRASLPSAPHQRLWWMELARGAITGACGLFFLTAGLLLPAPSCTAWEPTSSLTGCSNSLMSAEKRTSHA